MNKLGSYGRVLGIVFDQKKLVKCRDESVRPIYSGMAFVKYGYMRDAAQAVSNSRAGCQYHKEGITLPGFERMAIVIKPSHAEMVIPYCRCPEYPINDSSPLYGREIQEMPACDMLDSPIEVEQRDTKYERYPHDKDMRPPVTHSHR